MIDIPTGLGKTGAVAIGWLYRLWRGDDDTPRRLVWCLPMRVLVDQTHGVIEQWVASLEPVFEDRGLQRPTVETMKGGLQETRWAEQPEHPAVIVGTQDMLLSRALMRGYGMSRYAWPMHFAWLHNDSLWVFDETQLMGVAVETSAQLEAFRRQLGTARPSRSIWMSATLGQAQLATVDHPRPTGGWSTLSLTEADRASERVTERTRTQKALRCSEVAFGEDYAPALADRVLELHQPGTLTLAIVNRVERAQGLYRALRARAPHQQLAVLHSRFRPPDRRAHEQLLESDSDRIIVATQVVEAGVDVSASTMITELAPWPSLVQRFGRCNRYGEAPDTAVIEWIDLPAEDEPALPYDTDSLETARRLLRPLADAGPAVLAQVDYDPPNVVRPVIRRKDLVELFDTTPDLSGLDLDVSRYVRDETTPDVMVFWRDLEQPDAETAEPQRDELCPVTIGAISGLLKKKQVTGYIFDPLERCWREVTRPRPGQALLLPASAGGYSPEVGFTGEPAKQPAQHVVAIDGGDTAPSSMDDDRDTGIGRWVPLVEHLADVAHEARAVASALGVDQTWARRLEVAATWHDVGKAHEVFQAMLTAPGAANPTYAPPDPAVLWAKSNHTGGRSGRRHFRHELASALAYLANTEDGVDGEASAVAYLIAAHHGKVRLSIRALPGEAEPEHPEADGLFARGVWHGDILPAITLPDGIAVPETTLDLRLTRLGEGSWLERTLSLRDDQTIGPFRLAWYEAILRIADRRASALNGRGETHD